MPAAAVTPVNTNTGCIETQTEVLPRVLLEREMTKVLRSHYNSDSELRKIVSAFVRNIEKKLGALSLDDIERICERLDLTLILKRSSIIQSISQVEYRASDSVLVLRLNLNVQLSSHRDNVYNSDFDFLQIEFCAFARQ